MLVMAVVLTIVWGGFLFCLLMATLKESEKK